MGESSDPSLLQEYRREYGSGFHPLKLWRDRRAILADPHAVARPNPALANSPVRFALSLTLIPMLAIAWAMSQLVDLAQPDRARVGLYEQRSIVITQVLDAELPGLTQTQMRDVVGTTHLRDLPPDARRLAVSAVKLLAMRMFNDAQTNRAAMQKWLAEVHASTLTPAQQRVVIAKVALEAHRTGRHKLMDWLLRNIAEGGPLMQFFSVLSLLFGAWMFRMILTGDARFVHAPRADRFFLYYSSSRMFWWLIAQTAVFGAISYASAAGDLALFGTLQWVSAAVGLGTVVYLLCYSREMARALCDAESAPEGSGYAVGWRLLVSNVASTVVVMMLATALSTVLTILSLRFAPS